MQIVLPNLHLATHPPIRIQFQENPDHHNYYNLNNIDTDANIPLINQGKTMPAEIRVKQLEGKFGWPRAQKWLQTSECVVTINIIFQA